MRPTTRTETIRFMPSLALVVNDLAPHDRHEHGRVGNMVALGLGLSSLVLAVEGFVLRGRVRSSPAERRAIGMRSLSLIATTVPLVILGGLFFALAIHIA